MKKLFFLGVAATLISSISFAAIRRVGFFGTPVSGVDYSTLPAAYTAANSGDTILVFPGNWSFSSNINKKLIIIGPGYWLSPTTTPAGNANMQAFAGTATLSGAGFISGSAGSTIMGFDFGGTVVTAAENNITIQRNNNLTVNLVNAITNLQILENYRVRISYNSPDGSSSNLMTISNNLINYFSLTTANSYGGVISNNVWAYDGYAGSPDGGGTATSSNSTNDLGGGSFTLVNNIFCYYTSPTASMNGNFAFNNAGNCMFNYNLSLPCGSTSNYVSNLSNWAGGTGNVVTSIGNAGAIFTAFPAIGSASADARYQLASGSPALTVGQGSTPIGLFAGSTPYKLSLIPSIPTIYQLTSPNGNTPTGNSITINLSTRGNN